MDPDEVLAYVRQAPWMPSISHRLSDLGWSRLSASTSIDRSNYSTVSLKIGSCSAGPNALVEIKIPEEFRSAFPVKLEFLNRETEAQYIEIGLTFLTTAESFQYQAISRLESAFSLIGLVPDLAETLGTLVASIHLLRADDPDYDVSHSDPEVPFSVFVGLPKIIGALDRIRLAEELVHECMHLQLSLFERIYPLISGSTEKHHSPWQLTLRPTQGLLHGLYVFVVLEAFFNKLLQSAALTATEHKHCEYRIMEIRNDVDLALGTLAASDELTPLGLEFVENLLAKHRTAIILST